MCVKRIYQGLNVRGDPIIEKSQDQDQGHTPEIMNFITEPLIKYALQIVTDMAKEMSPIVRDKP